MGGTASAGVRATPKAATLWRTAAVWRMTSYTHSGAHHNGWTGFEATGRAPRSHQAASIARNSLDAEQSNQDEIDKRQR